MKPKKMSKKLNLNKQTVAIIGKEEMTNLRAGDMPLFLNVTPFVTQLGHQCLSEMNKKPTAFPPCVD